METEVFVYVDIAGAPYLAGRLWARTRKAKESATFEYDPDWLQSADRFSLEPALMLGPGVEVSTVVHRSGILSGQKRLPQTWGWNPVCGLAGVRVRAGKSRMSPF
jgi:serine/threonine-protein kinase HipA